MDQIWLKSAAQIQWIINRKLKFRKFSTSLLVWQQGIDKLIDEIKRLGDILINEVLIPIGVEHLTPSQSTFFKHVYRNPDRGVENFLAKKT